MIPTKPLTPIPFNKVTDLVGKHCSELIVKLFIQAKHVNMILQLSLYIVGLDICICVYIKMTLNGVMVWKMGNQTIIDEFDSFYKYGKAELPCFIQHCVPIFSLWYKLSKVLKKKIQTHHYTSKQALITAYAGPESAREYKDTLHKQATPDVGL